MIRKIIRKFKQIKKRKKEREDCVKYAMWTMSCSRKEAETISDKAYHKHHISYKDFARYELCRLPESEWDYEFGRRTAKRDRNKNKKDEKYLKKVCEKTGWDEEYARPKMEHAREISGASYENYYSFRFWELSDEQQKTYYTKGDIIALWGKYNTDSRIRKILQSKETTYQYLKDDIGRKWITTDNLTKEIVFNQFGKQGKIIYKPCVSLGGKGIKVYEYNEKNIDDIVAELLEKKRGVLEEFIVQHKTLAKFSQGSVNSIRIVTITTNDNNLGIEPGKTHFLFAGLRMGVGNHCVDNLHKGGLVAAVDIDTGKIISDGINYENEIFERHPDTNAKIKGTEIPYFQETKQLIEKISKYTPGFFGWDIAITEQGPVVIEINTSPGAGVLQSPYIPEKKGMKYIVEPYL